MSLKHRIDFSGLLEATAELRDEQAVATTGMVDQIQQGITTSLRRMTANAGLGQRLANTWRGKTYPARGVSLDPAGFIWTAAPKIIDAFDRGTTIYPVNGQRYLAIPTENVPPATGPRRRISSHMTPVDVEAAFNQDLIIRNGRQGHKLAFVDVVRARNGHGYRRATPRRVAAGRRTELVLMFVLTRTIVMRKRIDIQSVVDSWVGKAESLLASNWRET